jgi:hypothetical protein
MFFGDARAAFGNLARALRPGGRLVFVCWRQFEENPWMGLAFAALRQVLPGPAVAVDGANPYMFADPGSVRDVAAAAGLAELLLERTDQSVPLGPDLASAVSFSMGTGPTARALSGADEATRAAVRERISVALAPYLRPGGVSLPGSAWVVSARAIR